MDEESGRLPSVHSPLSTWPDGLCDTSGELERFSPSDVFSRHYHHDEPGVQAGFIENQQKNVK
jgi:hypothetical protein